MRSSQATEKVTRFVGFFQPKIKTNILYAKIVCLVLQRGFAEPNVNNNISFVPPPCCLPCFTQGFKGHLAYFWTYRKNGAFQKNLGFLSETLSKSAKEKQIPKTTPSTKARQSIGIVFTSTTKFCLGLWIDERPVCWGGKRAMDRSDLEKNEEPPTSGGLNVLRPAFSN